MQVNSLVRSLSLKLSRENLAAREKDVETPDVVVEEQSDVDNAEQEGDPPEFESEEEDLSESREDSSNVEVVVESEEVVTVEPSLEQSVDDSVEEQDLSAKFNPPLEQSVDDYVEAQDSLPNEPLHVECQEETEVTAEQSEFCIG